MTTFDTSLINSIEDAKKQNYNGKVLDDADKVIFEWSGLKDSSTPSKADLILLREAAVILNIVKRVDSLTRQEPFLLSQLKKAKRANSEPYKAVNSVKNYVDTAIFNMEKLPVDETQNQKLNEAKKKLAATQKKLQEEEGKKLKIEEDLKDMLENRESGFYKAASQLSRLEKIRGAIETKINEIKASGAGKKILDFIKTLSENYVANLGRMETKLTEPLTKKGNSGNLLKFIGTNSIMDVARFLVSAVQDLERKELEDAGVSDGDALAAFEKLKKFKFTNCQGNLLEQNIDSNPTSISDWEEKEKVIESTGGYEKVDKWPFVHFSLSDLFVFMEKVFPENDYGPDATTLGKLLDKSGSKRLSDKNLDKEYKIKKVLFSEKDLAIDKDKQFKGESVEWKLKWGDGTLPKFFYQIFFEKRDIGKKGNFIMKKDGNLEDENISQYEVDNITSRNQEIWSRIAAASYVMWVEEEVKKGLTVGTGTEKTDFEKDGWAKVAREVAKSALNIKWALVAERKQGPKGWESFKNELRAILVPKKITFYQKTQSYLESIEPKKDYEIDIWDKMLSDYDVRIISAKAEVEVFKEEEREKNRELRKIIAEIKKQKQQELLDQREVETAEGTDLETLKVRFKSIYKQGPAKEKYGWDDIIKMESDLMWIEIREPSGSLQGDYIGYKVELDNLAKKLDKIQKDYRFGYELLRVGKTITKSLAAIGFRSDEEKKQRLQNARDCLKEIEKIRKLDPVETAQLAEVGELLIGDAPPSVTLSKEDLKEVFHGKETANFTDATYQLDEWKKTKIFKAKAKIEELVNLVWDSANNKPKDAFADFLDTTDNWGISKIKKDANQWENFVKKEPKYVIAAIKFFTDYKQKPGEQAAIKTAMNEANGDKPKETPWNTEDEKSIAEYLYMKADGQKLTKDQRTGDDGGGGGGSPQEGGFWSAYGYMAIWLPLSIVAVAGILIYVYWEAIVNWWNGPAEEEGMGGKTDEEEES